MNIKEDYQGEIKGENRHSFNKLNPGLPLLGAKRVEGPAVELLIHSHTCTHTHTHAGTHMHTCAQTHRRRRVCTHTHTHTHTQNREHIPQSQGHYNKRERVEKESERGGWGGGGGEEKVGVKTPGEQREHGCFPHIFDSLHCLPCSECFVFNIVFALLSLSSPLRSPKAFPKHKQCLGHDKRLGPWLSTDWLHTTTHTVHLNPKPLPLSASGQWLRGNPMSSRYDRLKVENYTIR